MPRRVSKKIYLISDSTGELAERFTNAIISQFPEDRIVVDKYSFVRDAAEAERLIGHFEAKGAILFHTVLSPDLKRDITRLSASRRIPSYDLTGTATDFVVQHLKAKPEWNVSQVHRIDESYDRRIDAIEFAINHDDGAGQSNVKRADVILVGPSRSSKTPTSMYLAVKGVRAANIPLVMEIDQSDKLEPLRGDKRVVGFVIAPAKLREMRLKRASELGTDPPGYTELDRIRKEVSAALRVYQRYEWRTIDVTDRAIEETAAMILRMIQKTRR